MMSRRSLFTGLVILSIFLAGALSGAAVVRMLSGPDGVVATEASGDDGPERRGNRGRGGGGDGPEDGPSGPFAFSRFLEEELDLTPEQRAEVQAILERREEEARRMFRESRGRFQEHLEGTVEEVEEALPSGQASEFRQLIEELERRFRRGGENGPPGPPPLGDGSRH